MPPKQMFQDKLWTIDLSHLNLIIKTSITNRNRTSFSATASRRISTTKPASQESILRDMQNYLTIYGGKVT